ncbi:MAG: type II toxin-antitoxin system PemK/MazF family toxin [bacterium]|nr:type II toxin-antitoxin system PemK/MazF family toxin [bacterium]
MVIRRGDVRWAFLPTPSADLRRLRRPVLVISSDAFNRSRLGTVLAVVLSPRPELAQSPGNVVLDAATTGLRRDAVANVAQVVTLSRSCLSERVGKTDASSMQDVDKGLRLAAGLAD